MANTITESGIDPTSVVKFVGDINDIKNKIADVHEYIRTNVKSDINDAYGGNAADALMGNTTTLMDECDAALEEILKDVVTNVNDDLSDAQNTDNNLAGK